MSFNLVVSFFLALFFCLKGFSAEKNLIDLSKVKKVSYLLAASRGLGKSSFGHSYLRFSYKDKFSTFDPVIEFVADVPANNINVLKGMGVGSSYDAVIVSTNYKNVQTHHNIREDRDLTSYPLKISQAQTEELVNKINSLLTEGTNRKYTFFKTNCANLLSSVFKNTLDEDIKGIRTIIPVALPGLLRKNELLTGEEEIDYGVTRKRETLFSENFPKDLIDKNPLYLQNIEAQLTSKNISQRLLAFTKLHLVRESLNDQDRKAINLLSLKLVMLESHGVRNYILPYFTKKDQSLRGIQLELIPAPARAREVVEIGFKNKKDEVYLFTKVKTSSSSSARKTKKSNIALKTSKVNNLSYSDGKILSNGEVISRKYSNNIVEKEFFDESLFLNAEIVTFNGRKYILPIMAQEIEQMSYETKLESKDILSVKNGHKLNGVRIPMCYATIELQQLLLTRVVWAPELAPLSEMNALKALSALFNGKIVVIPGFEDISSFTSSLSQDAVAKIIKQRQETEYSFSQRAKDWFSFSDQKIKASDVYILKNMLEKGVFPKVYFNVEGRQEGGIRIAHGVLVTGIEEDADNFYLETYDPNFGLLKIKSDEKLSEMREKLASSGRAVKIAKSYFAIRKSDSTLVTSAYNNSKLILPEYSLETQHSYNLVIKNEKLKERAIFSYTHSKNFIYSVGDFF